MGCKILSEDSLFKHADVWEFIIEDHILPILSLIINMKNYSTWLAIMFIFIKNYKHNAKIAYRDVFRKTSKIIIIDVSLYNPRKTLSYIEDFRKNYVFQKTRKIIIIGVSCITQKNYFLYNRF